MVGESIEIRFKLVNFDNIIINFKIMQLKLFYGLVFLFTFSGCSAGFSLNQESCNQLNGWKWSTDIEACVSKDLTNGLGMYTWNGYGTFFSHGNDESPVTMDNLTPEYGTTYAFVDFECLITPESDTLQKRMQLASLADWKNLLKMLDKDEDLVNPTALAVADCIDGVKDLDFSNFKDAGFFEPNWSQDEVNKRNCYLSGDFQGEGDQNKNLPGLDSQCAFFGVSSAEETWAWKQANQQFSANSHLLTPWEFKQACGLESGDAFNYDETNTFNWVAAIGYISGADWAFGARNLGKTSCEKENFEDTGAVNDIYGFRVVVRP